MSTSPSVRDFISTTRKLLATEWVCETSLAVSELDATSKHVLERKGISLADLRIDSISTGMYGRRVAAFAPFRGQLLKSHSLSVGDVVRLVPNRGPEKGGATPPSGIVSKVTEQRLSVAFDDKIDDGALAGMQFGEDPLRLDRLPNEAANKKVLSALTALEKVGARDPAEKIVAAVFGEKEPVQVQAKEPPGQDWTWVNGKLNSSQKRAIGFALRSRDVALIHGPPGTGKTTAVVELIVQAACMLGLKVLVCAPSNVAVDNIAARLAGVQQEVQKRKRKAKRKTELRELRMVRLGHPARLLPAVLQFSLDAVLSRADGSEIIKDVKKEMDTAIKSLQPKGRKKERVNFKATRATVKELRKEIRTRERKLVGQVLSGCNVVLATNVGAASVRKLTDDVFDLVIIDEAAQAIEASCWLPILYGRRLVLAGDHHQLPPTVKSDEASALSVTLFARLSKIHPNVVQMLDVQYRSHHSIMDFSSQEFYDSKLRSHESVSERRLALTLEENEAEDDPYSATLILVDTSGYDLQEREEDEDDDFSGSKLNDGEAEIVEEHVKALLNRGVKPEEIAVITPYNAQVHLLRTKLLESFPQLEIRSVDGFQGREKEVVVLSLVRSNDVGEVGFLADARRLNVAITRARSQVCLICDTSTLINSNNGFLKRMVDYFEKHALIRTPSEYLDWCTPSHTPCAALVQQGVDKSPVYESKLKVFMGSHDQGLQFDKDLNAGARREVHELAEKHGLLHASLGEGEERFVLVWKTLVAAQEDLSNRFKTTVSEKVAAGINANTAAVECIKYFREAMARVENMTKQMKEQSAAKSSPKAKTPHAKPKSMEAKGHLSAFVDAPKVARPTESNNKIAKAKAVLKDENVTLKGTPDTLHTRPKTVVDCKVDTNASKVTTEKSSNLEGNKEDAVQAITAEGVSKPPPTKDPLADELNTARALQAARHKAARAREMTEWVGDQPAARTLQGNNSKAKSKSKKGKKSKNKAKKKPRQPADRPEVGSLATKEALGNGGGDEIDDEMALLNSLVSAKSSCAHKGCKKNNRYGDTCRLCKFRYCQEHALPEVHGCGAAAKTQARSTPWITSGGILHGTSHVSSEKRQQLRKKLGKKIVGEQDKRKSKAKPKKESK